MSDDYPVLATEPIFTGNVISVRLDRVQMSDGTVAVREVVDHPGAVGVVALDDDGTILLVNQYRHPVRARLDELPAGLLDVDGEPALLAAQRELAEEAAVTATDWHVLVDLYTSPGMSNEAIRLFLARGLVPVPDDERFQPEHEEITLTVHRVPIAEAVERVFAGELTNAAAVAGILATAHGEATGWAGLRPADAPWPARPGH
ncbi:MAG: 8-oxo-dGDP phosphatase [Pseudonocardiales bacterium]|nr:8-oxo-dGDP phosphatase [Pseudonocardiales bacterium]MDT4960432.1 8-oxo-dGDP phosphatase [Pseudonocardiales bacterium]MDT4976296.1 8-oxo-dGDP phosphatase [Pseudonocardiales bacterium]MDT4980884.1 8-oxo-dGDP phosphatase [Pseudonocardiales bacterium]MDT4983725.1 8-oxo-dGDP phosphatase [Pseudonocardiales bacterium]